MKIIEILHQSVQYSHCLVKKTRSIPDDQCFEQNIFSVARTGSERDKSSRESELLDISHVFQQQPWTTDKMISGLLDKGHCSDCRN